MRKRNIIAITAILILTASVLPTAVSAVNAQETTDNIGLAHLDGKTVVNNPTSNNITKAGILRAKGVPGKGLDHALGLHKPFNPKSKAAQNIGKEK